MRFITRLWVEEERYRKCNTWYWKRNIRDGEICWTPFFID